MAINFEEDKMAGIEEVMLEIRELAIERPQAG